MGRKANRMAGLVAMVSLFLAACARPAPSQVSEQTTRQVAETILSTATSSQTPPPTNTPTPTVTPEPSATPTSTATATPVPTDTPRPTKTPTPVPAFTLSGVVFFDYNGNGVQDDHEPPIQDATVQVGDLTAVSAPDGSYTLVGVPHGQREVEVSAEGFRYVSLSSAAFQPLNRTISLTIGANTGHDWGLMHGFLTLPFVAGTYMTRQYSYFDLDPGPGIRDWRNSGLTMDGHRGVDYGFNEGTQVVAAAPGIVTEAVNGWSDSSDPSVREDGNRVFIDHGYRFETFYCHLLEALVQKGSRVSRGQVIGYSGNTGTASGAPHLHFQLNSGSRPTDPYRDPQDSDSVCQWTKDNDPQYP